MRRNASGLPYIVTPKHFRLTETQNFGLHFSNADMGREMRYISSSFGSADMLCSATYTDIAEMHADVFNIIWPGTHHKTPHIGTDFRPLDPWSFWSDFAPPDI